MNATGLRQTQQSGSSSQDDLARIAVQVVHHAAFVIEDHGAVGVRVGGAPCDAGDAGLAGGGNLAQDAAIGMFLS
jgi:hypothetical protein